MFNLYGVTLMRPQCNAVTYTPGVRLYPCGDAGYQDVVENTTITFYCDEYTGSVDWRFKPLTSHSPSSVSACPATMCDPPPASVWTVTFITVTTNTLTGH
eukprot:TRINITY_DN25969_c0_g3_i1.p1 TRINITY_DN25969_c0_g3~~TRINITY_DN25969_c0_g3_i1.p1  ORF type:complete len:107 (-),score=19.93 TRINITY_DN25969_c0_g3_i1:246-545(-)